MGKNIYLWEVSNLDAWPDCSKFFLCTPTVDSRRNIELFFYDITLWE